jgi:hypothetical protein
LKNDKGVDELTRFIANPAPEPTVRKLQIPYYEVLRLVELVLIRAAWLPNPTAFRDPGPAAIPLEYASPRPGWRVVVDFPGFSSEHPSDEKVLPKTLT